jgi:hypothetical protein
MRWILAGFALISLATSLHAQTLPDITELRTPYAPLHAGVRMWGVAYDPNTVPYGPAGTPVTISGSNLGSGGTVNFAANGGTIAATVTSWTPTKIQATVPGGANSGLVTVFVTIPSGGGLTSNPLPFAVMQGTYQTASCGSSLPGPVIASMVPASGPTGTLVTLFGSNFRDSQGASSLTLSGGAVGVAQWTDTVIMFHVPSSAQTGSVIVTTDVGNSNGSTFTVQSATPPASCQ